MLAAAFIANDKVGTIRLEVHSKKFFLGLFTASNLLVVPRRRAIEWHSPSLEATVVEISKELLSYARKNAVQDVVYKWMSRNSSNPWESASEKVKEQLVSRGLLEKIEESPLLIFKKHRFSIPTSTLDIVSQAPISVIDRMISDFQRIRPDMSERLIKEASKGVLRRREATSIDQY
jgi:hypothetical protein